MLILNITFAQMTSDSFGNNTYINKYHFREQVKINVSPIHVWGRRLFHFWVNVPKMNHLQSHELKLPQIVNDYDFSNSVARLNQFPSDHCS